MWKLVASTDLNVATRLSGPSALVKYNMEASNNTASRKTASIL